MANEEMLREVKNTFKLEGININTEQENRVKQYLSGEVSFNELIDILLAKYQNINTE